jgi:hypothetical protein
VSRATEAPLGRWKQLEVQKEVYKAPRVDHDQRHDGNEYHMADGAAATGVDEHAKAGCRDDDGTKDLGDRAAQVGENTAACREKTGGIAFRKGGS